MNQLTFDPSNSDLLPFPYHSSPMDSCLELLVHQVHLEKLVKEQTQELTTVNENLKKALVKR